MVKSRAIRMLLLLCLGSITVPVPALAQIDAPPTVISRPATPSISAIIESARVSYANAPYTERLDIEVADLNGRVSRSSIRVAVDPVPALGEVVPSAPSRISLELGSLRVWIARGELVAIHARDQSGWWGIEADETDAIELLRRWVPPTPLPSLSILTGRLPLIPAVPEIEWLSVAPSESEDAWVLAGRAADVAVQATFAMHDSKLTRLVAAGPGMGTVQRIQILVRPETHTNEVFERPSIQERERRLSLSEILQMRANVKVGDPLPRFACVREDGRAWSVRETLTEMGVGVGSGQAPGMVLLLVRATVDGMPADVSDLRAAISLIRRFDRERDRTVFLSGTQQPLPRVKAITCVVFELETFSAAVFDQFIAELPDAAGDDPGIVWTSPARQSIDAIAPNAASAAVVLNSDGTIRGVVAIDGLAAGSADVATRLNAEIRQAFSP